MYQVKFWTTGTATQAERVEERRPACAGAFLSRNPGCAQRPSHTLAWVENSSGRPGQGRERVYYACHRHLHRVLTHGVGVSLGYVTVSAYEGV